MKCMVVILNHLELLDELLMSLGHHGVHGATILDSTEMAKRLYNHEHQDEAERFLGSLRVLLNPEREQSKTIFCVLREEQVESAKDAVRVVLNHFEELDTGIMFMLPVDFVEGGSFSH